VIQNGSAEARPSRKRGATPAIAARGAANGPFRARPVPGWETLLCAASLLWFTGVSASAAEAKRVLIVHSFGSVAPPFTIHSMAFETELAEKIGERVDLDEISLDMARYNDPGLQDALVEYLQKRQAKWQPDLVVPIGSPAGIFVAQYRERLFPGTPILYTGMDRRRLPGDALEKNAAFVGESYNVAGFVEDILQIAPDTKNIAVVIGASPLERYWASAFQKEFEPFADRVNFIWLNDLPFDQMLERVAKLPPHSYIFLILLLRDASGVTHNADEALQRLHAVANAPINSIFTHQLGLGIVGGRLYTDETEGIEAAHIAIRILHGEPASNFPPKILGALPPSYDWRELQRWKIKEELLPPGSKVLFRAPTVWEQHRDWILGGASVALVEALLITVLLANLIRRRRAECSLRESEQRFRVMADAAPVLMWMAGPDRLCTFFNSAWLNFTGRNLEQESGGGWAEGVHPDDFKKCFETFETAVDRHLPFVMQYRLRRHDGVYRTVTSNAIPRYDARDKFLGYIGACVDITDLLVQQEALHESEERIALAAEAAQLGVWEVDAATNQLWTSEKIRELFRFEPGAEITYADFQGRVHPEDRDERDKAIRRALETDGGYENEFRILLPDGNIRWLAGRARCLSNGSGAKRLLGVSMDVTQRKEAEDLFRLAAEASPSGTILVDNEGGIVLINTHIEELSGYTREDLIGRPIETLIPDWLRVAHQSDRVAFLSAALNGDPRAGRELVGRRKDGSKFPIEIGWNPIQTAQGILALVNVVDISARKAAEEEARRQREQVELLGRVSLLGEMTASLAHELNQPLSAIVSNADAAMYYVDKGHLDPHQLHEIMADVVADAGRAHDIIQGVRNAVKKGTMARRRVNLNELVEKVMHMVQHDAAAKFCRVQTSLAQEKPAVDGDPTQLQQVLINLVNNAVEAMHAAPLYRRSVQIATAQNGSGTVRIEVSDTGPGFSESERVRMFENFFTTKKDGLGMGLAIVQSIVKAHGGTIEAENIQGGGARFFFHLPLSEGTSP